MITQLPAAHRWRLFDRWWERAFYRELGSRLPRDGSEIRTSIVRRSEAVFREDAETVTDRPSQHHLLMLCCVLASYRVLVDRGLDPDEARRVVQPALVRPGTKLFRWAQIVGLWLSRDPFTMLKKWGRSQVLESRYGDWFDFEDEEEPGRFATIVTGCGYHEFFVRHDAPHLTPIFCAWDEAAWAGPIDPERHGVAFERPTTIAGGAPTCRFEFRRVEGEEEGGEA